jgi:hypothetical protein
VSDAIGGPKRYGQKDVLVKYLEEDRQQAKKLGIILHPSITINNITYRGEIDGHDIFKAICAGFLDQPEICKGESVFAIVNGDNSELIYHRNSLVRVYHIISAIILVLIINAIALCLYRKHQKKKVNEELHLQVNSAVSSYFKLSGQESI